MDAANEGTEAAEHMLHRNHARKKRELNSGSNPQSKWRQRQEIKKQYIEARRAASAGSTAANTQNTAKGAEKAARTVRDTAKRALAAAVSAKKGLLLVLGLALIPLMLASGLSSCSVLISGLGANLASTSYPVSDEDLQAAEEAYCAMEAELQEYLNAYEDEHDYDSYSYDLDDIGHDPYVLLSAITALQGGEWTIDDIEETLQTLFEQQYTLTETTDTSGEGENETTSVTVKLENCDLSHVPILVMSEEQLGLYANYMSTLGNRSELFPDSEYVPRYITEGYTDHEIPPEALEDETFAAMITEAEKYLGFPYVWGGSSPETSFDCSGFVSWVVNQSGWNVGRLGAQGLYDICTPVSEPAPGDLVFFTGTYDAGVPVSHVGLYVGDNWMIHAGDPVSYQNLSGSYYQSHFYAWGRLPES